MKRLFLILVVICASAMTCFADYLEIAALTTNENLVTRTTVAVAKSASYVLAGGGSPCVERVARAREALRHPRLEAVEHFMWHVALNGDVQEDGEAVADSVIQFIVDTYFVSHWGSCT